MGGARRRRRPRGLSASLKPMKRGSNAGLRAPAAGWVAPAVGAPTVSRRYPMTDGLYWR
jgi:hypothetical protein